MRRSPSGPLASGQSVARARRRWRVTRRGFPHRAGDRHGSERNIIDMAGTLTSQRRVSAKLGGYSQEDLEAGASQFAGKDLTPVRNAMQELPRRAFAELKEIAPDALLTKQYFRKRRLALVGPVCRRSWLSADGTGFEFVPRHHATESSTAGASARDDAAAQRGGSSNASVRIFRHGWAASTAST